MTRLIQLRKFIFCSGCVKCGRELDDDRDFAGVLFDGDLHIDATVGVSEWITAEGWGIPEEDYRVAGEVWRVHKTDADQFPSRPHAHCVGGAKRFVGLTLHLGAAEPYHGRKPPGRFLHSDQFARLIGMIRPKFPDTALPLQG